MIMSTYQNVIEFKRPSGQTVSPAPADAQSRPGSVWLSWPTEATVSAGLLHQVRDEFVSLCRAIVDRDPVLHTQRGESISVIVPNPVERQLAQSALDGIGARIFVEPAALSVPSMPLFRALPSNDEMSVQVVDEEGELLREVRIPSPGEIADDSGKAIPASYLDFYVSRTTVAVPTFNSPRDRVALERIGELFPNRRVIGVPSLGMLRAGKTLRQAVIASPHESSTDQIRH
jgi:agmatine/peptidylarginine deiminase